jgi:hypothetical protein
MVPTLVELHVTPLVEPVTVAVKVWVCPAVTVAVFGDRLTLIAVATRFPIRYFPSSDTADDEWPTLLKALVASAPQ